MGNVGSHSLKATYLSWAAKFGLKGGDQRILGYHAKSKDASVGDYARDSFAAPLRELKRVLDAVASGRFDPDATRSGQWRDRSQEEAPAAPLEGRSLADVGDQSKGPPESAAGSVREPLAAESIHASRGPRKPRGGEPARGG